MKRRTLVRALGTSLGAPLGAWSLWPRAASAAPAAPGGPGDIVLGQSGILSGPLGQQILVFNQGARLAFDHFNAGGGLGGRAVRMVSLDDELKPDKAVANYNTLLTEHKATAFFGCVGSGPTAAASAVMARSGVPSFGGYAVSDAARDKAKGHAYFVRAGYGREVEALIQHLGTIGISRVACAYLDNPGGVEVISTARRLAGEFKVTLSAEAAIAGNGKNLPEAVKAVAAADPQAVIMFLGAPLAAGLMEGLWAADRRPSYYGMSIVAGDAVAAKIGNRARGLAIAQAMPYPWAVTDPDVRQYHAVAQAAKQPVSYTAFEGYANATLMLEVLRRSRDLSPQGLHAAIRALHVRFAKMDLDYTRGQHTGSRFIELVQVTHEGRFLR